MSSSRHTNSSSSNKSSQSLKPRMTRRDRAVLQVHTAIGHIAALDTDLAALTELKEAYCDESHLAVLCESGIVPLLLQSLVLHNNSSSTDNSAATARVLTIVALFKAMIWHDGGREFLRYSGAFESLIAVMPHLQTDRELTALIDVANSLSVNSTIPTPTRLAVLAQVQAHMCAKEQRERQSQQQSKTEEQNKEEDDYYFSLGGLIGYILSPSKKMIYTSDAPRILYANVSTVVPLLRSVIRRHVLPSESRRSSYKYVAIYDALRSVYKFGYIADSNDVDSDDYFDIFGLNNDASDSDDDDDSNIDDQDKSCGDDCGNGSGDSDQSDNNSGNSNVPIDEQCRRDFADFVASEDFEPLLSDLSVATHLRPLCEYLPLFDDAILTRMFTKQRIEDIIVEFDTMASSSIGQMSMFMKLSAQLATRFPTFAQRISFVTCFGKILSVIEDEFSDCNSKYYWEMLCNTATVLDRTLNAASDVMLTAQQLLESNVVPLCCTLLRPYVVARWERLQKTSHPSILPIALLLRVLRVIMRTRDTSPDFAALDSKDEPRNSFVTQFVQNHGVRLLEMLRDSDCSSIAGGREVLQELTQMHTLLVGMVIIPPGTATTKSSDAPSLQKDWQKTFDAHIARVLEKSGYPQRVKSGRHAAASSSIEYPPVVAPKRGTKTTGAPSAAARTQGTKATNEPSAVTLAMMQKMANESLLVSAKMRLTAQFRRNDLIMALRLNEADEYWIMIETHEHLSPCSVLHFRISAIDSVIGSKLHTCFAPPAHHAAAPLPFITLYSESSALSRASVPLQLPKNNIVYGESSELTTYPVGTVLFYPPSVIPVRPSCTPWFIVYKPCPASLLGGAVPIGRVTACKKDDDEPDFSEEDEEEPKHIGKRDKKKLFDDNVLKCFEACCHAKNCSSDFNTTFREFYTAWPW